MADTVRGDFPNELCECGRKGCHFCHWGPLVPPGKPRYLCAETMAERAAFYRENGKTMPDELVTKHHDQ